MRSAAKNPAVGIADPKKGAAAKQSTSAFDTTLDYDAIEARYNVANIRTDLSMQSISEQCGFSDANYFARTFKKMQGMSPLKYRQSLLG